jgi:hypothetical protein
MILPDCHGQAQQHAEDPETDTADKERARRPAHDLPLHLLPETIAEWHWSQPELWLFHARPSQWLAWQVRL